MHGLLVVMAVVVVTVVVRGDTVVAVMAMMVDAVRACRGGNGEGGDQCKGECHQLFHGNLRLLWTRPSGNRGGLS